MDNFCRRCGSKLGEDGMCPNCDTSYSIDEVFDEPVFLEDTYDADNDDSVVDTDSAGDVSNIEYAEQVDDNTDYAVDNYGYDNQSGSEDEYFTKTEQDYGSENIDYSNYNDYSDYASQDSAEEEDRPRRDSQPDPKKSFSGLVECLKNWIDCAVSFFKDGPFAAVDKVLDGGMHLWAIFAGLNVIFGAFCIAGMFGNGFVWLVDEVFGSYAMLISFYKEYTFGNIFVLFLFSLLTVLLLLLAIAGCEYALFVLSQKKPRVERVIRIVAISFFPMTIACVAAYIFSFLLMRVAATIIFAGAIASFRLLNQAAEREAGEFPFWNVVLCNIAQMVAAVIIVGITLAVV